MGNTFSGNPCEKKIFVAADKRLHVCEKIGNENSIGEVKDGELKLLLDVGYVLRHY